MTDKNKTIIEINGVKMEVDTRTATRVDQFKVGSRVKVLLKSDYSAAEVHSGVIVGFDLFKDLPTLTVMYIKRGYSDPIQYTFFNTESKNVEIVLDVDEGTPFSKENVIQKMNAEMEKKELELTQLQQSKQFFIDTYGEHFEENKDDN